MLKFFNYRYSLYTIEVRSGSKFKISDPTKIFWSNGSGLAIRHFTDVTIKKIEYEFMFLDLIRHEKFCYLKVIK